MPRLIAVSSRVAVAGGAEHAERSALGVALGAALRESNGFWFGWSGQETDTFSGQIAFRRSDGVATAAVDLAPEDAGEYRGGFASRTLWPVCHDRLDLAELERDPGDGYARLNWRFAETLAPLIEADDLVWVHDHHLIPLGQELRERGFGNRIGFFLHIPWPPAHVLLALPDHRALVLALLAYDVVGFQTHEGRAALCDYATERLGAAIEGEDVVLGERRTRLLVCPMGLDAADFAGAVHSLVARAAETRLALSGVGQDLVLAVDRADPSKGLTERLAAYALLFEERADLLGKLVLLQIAPGAHDDVPGEPPVRAAFEAQAGRINAAFGTIDWVPVRHVGHAFSRDELFGIYRAARVGLVTPLRDGMNLVAKEYVAAQDPADPGVLVLSRFAGAAAQLPDALIVDPHCPEEVAAAIARALAMPLAERQERHKALLANVTGEDVHWWADRFLSALAEAPARKPGAHLVAAAPGR